ncbi:class F sortase [Streptomyces sp. NBC_01180]|uniref:class F sortase n=1 Tax=Streptomyces sp. NBC_01180 TaxID=2903763 RepID=UPI00386DBF05|nr:class F sortase [Streptomyces sp. NBC_01180]
MTFSLVTGVVWACSDSPDKPPATSAASAPRPGPPGVPAHAPLPPATPTKLAIPALVIEAPVIGLELDRHGRLNTPPMSRPHEVGWYRGGPAPGAAGTAVIVGHRDTRTGAAIFLNLNALHSGDLVNVTRADHRTAVFRVDSVKTYKKKDFPDSKVYGNTGRPELRLLTCGGTFDKKSGYGANVVVFAHLKGVRKT